jgi:hypothetical protein
LFHIPLLYFLDTGGAADAVDVFRSSVLVIVGFGEIHPIPLILVKDRAEVVHVIDAAFENFPAFHTGNRKRRKGLATGFHRPFFQIFGIGMIMGMAVIVSEFLPHLPFTHTVSMQDH